MKEVQERLHKLALGITEEIPADWGFVLIAFPAGDKQGRLCYVSNGSRSCVMDLLRKFVKRTTTPGAFGSYIKRALTPGSN